MGDPPVMGFLLEKINLTRDDSRTEFLTYANINKYF